MLEHEEVGAEGEMEEVERSVAFDDGVVEEGGASVGAGEDVGGVSHAPAEGVGRDELGADEVVVGDAEGEESSVELLDDFG